MELDVGIAAASLLVGFTVGLTGMGGGALMTPMLVLLFRVDPLAAVSSDLVAAVIMKPVGGGVHLRRGTVDMRLVWPLVLGSVPAAFAGVLVLEQLGEGPELEQRLRVVLGVALVVAATAMLAKALLQARRATRSSPIAAERIKVRPLATVLVGVVGGLLVGMTSVGSGSLIMVMLLLLYPSIRTAELVGTDLVQAVPLVASAAAGHLLFGEVELGLTTSLLIGSVPGVYVGARVSSWAPDALIRPVLIAVVLASGLKLAGLTVVQTGLALAVVGALVLLARRLLPAAVAASDR